MSQLIIITQELYNYDDTYEVFSFVSTILKYVLHNTHPHIYIRYMSALSSDMSITIENTRSSAR